jgi:predicted RNA methylase
VKKIDLETRRLSLQYQLDNKKTQQDRNKLGQFATPTLLAKSIVEHSISLLGQQTDIHFLDPAFGTGSFFSALLSMERAVNIVRAQGFEIDPCYAESVRELWRDTSLNLDILDFTRLSPPNQQSERFNLIICNPPYIRHHHLSREEKIRLQELTLETCEMRMSGLAGLYCYFLCLAHSWMMKGGIAGWLIPSEFMDVNYGQAIKNYLLKKVTLIQIHRFDSEDVKFDDALVSSAIVWMKNTVPPPNHQVLFTFGDSLSSPKSSKLVNSSSLMTEPKWTRFPSWGIRHNSGNFCLADIFEIKRGIATGDNAFFILTEKQVKEHKLPTEFLKPIIPSPRYLSTDVIQADNEGTPLLERRLFLLDCNLPEEEVQKKYPKLWEYLKLGKGTVSERYLCRHRKIWYSQEKRYTAPILCTYFGRNRGNNGCAFRFILNHSNAIAPNVYLLLYPHKKIAQYLSLEPSGIRKIWERLNSMNSTSFLAEGRIYGGGLHKIEPKELGKVDATSIIDVLPAIAKPTKVVQYSLFET